MHGTRSQQLCDAVSRDVAVFNIHFGVSIKYVFNENVHCNVVCNFCAKGCGCHRAVVSACLHPCLRVGGCMCFCARMCVHYS